MPPIIVWRRRWHLLSTDEIWIFHSMMQSINITILTMYLYISLPIILLEGKWFGVPTVMVAMLIVTIIADNCVSIWSRKGFFHDVEGTRDRVTFWVGMIIVWKILLLILLTYDLDISPRPLVELPLQISAERDANTQTTPESSSWLWLYSSSTPAPATNMYAGSIRDAFEKPAWEYQELDELVGEIDDDIPDSGKQEFMGGSFVQTATEQGDHLHDMSHAGGLHGQDEFLDEDGGKKTSMDSSSSSSSCGSDSCGGGTTSEDEKNGKGSIGSSSSCCGGAADTEKSNLESDIDEDEHQAMTASARQLSGKDLLSLAKPYCEKIVQQNFGIEGGLERKTSCIRFDPKGPREMLGLARSANRQLDEIALYPRAMATPTEELESDQDEDLRRAYNMREEAAKVIGMEAYEWKRHKRTARVLASTGDLLPPRGGRVSQLGILVYDIIAEEEDDDVYQQEMARIMVSKMRAKNGNGSGQSLASRIGEAGPEGASATPTRPATAATRANSAAVVDAQGNIEREAVVKQDSRSSFLASPSNELETESSPRSSHDKKAGAGRDGELTSVDAGEHSEPTASSFLQSSSSSSCCGGDDGAAEEKNKEYHAYYTNSGALMLVQTGETLGSIFQYDRMIRRAGAGDKVGHRWAYVLEEKKDYFSLRLLTSNEEDASPEIRKLISQVRAAKASFDMHRILHSFGNTDSERDEIEATVNPLSPDSDTSTGARSSYISKTESWPWTGSSTSGSSGGFPDDPENSSSGLRIPTVRGSGGEDVDIQMPNGIRGRKKMESKPLTFWKSPALRGVNFFSRRKATIPKTGQPKWPKLVRVRMSLRQVYPPSFGLQANSTYSSAVHAILGVVRAISWLMILLFICVFSDIIVEQDPEEDYSFRTLLYGCIFAEDREGRSKLERMRFRALLPSRYRLLRRILRWYKVKRKNADRVIRNMCGWLGMQVLTPLDMKYAWILARGVEFGGALPCAFLERGTQLDPDEDLDTMLFIMTYSAYAQVAYGFQGVKSKSLCEKVKSFICSCGQAEGEKLFEDATSQMFGSEVFGKAGIAKKSKKDIEWEKDISDYMKLLQQRQRSLLIRSSNDLQNFNAAAVIRANEIGRPVSEIAAEANPEMTVLLRIMASRFAIGYVAVHYQHLFALIKKWSPMYSTPKTRWIAAIYTILRLCKHTRRLSVALSVDQIDDVLATDGPREVSEYQKRYPTLHAEGEAAIHAGTAAHHGRGRVRTMTCTTHPGDDFGIVLDDGFQVVAVKRDSLAHKAGLCVGDSLSAVNGKSVVRTEEPGRARSSSLNNCPTGGGRGSANLRGRSPSGVGVQRRRSSSGNSGSPKHEALSARKIFLRRHSGSAAGHSAAGLQRPHHDRYDPFFDDLVRQGNGDARVQRAEGEAASFAGSGSSLQALRGDIEYHPLQHMTEKLAQSAEKLTIEFQRYTPGGSTVMEGTGRRSSDRSRIGSTATIRDSAASRVVHSFGSASRSGTQSFGTGGTWDEAEDSMTVKSSPLIQHGRGGIVQSLSVQESANRELADALDAGVVRELDWGYLSPLEKRIPLFAQMKHDWEQEVLAEAELHREMRRQERETLEKKLLSGLRKLQMGLHTGGQGRRDELQMKVGILQRRKRELDEESIASAEGPDPITRAAEAIGSRGGMCLEEVGIELLYCNARTQGGERSVFQVVLDHFSNALVITCRGTTDAKDVVSDCSIAPAKCFADDPDDEYVHAAFLACARFCLSCVEKEGFIRMLPATYSVVTTGHSLGGGIASVLGFLIAKRYPELLEQKRLRCLLIAPPGMTCSKALRKFSLSYMTTLVCGMDGIPRSRGLSIVVFRHFMAECLRKARFSKYGLLHTELSELRSRLSHFWYKINQSSFFPTSPFNVLFARKFEGGELNREERCEVLRTSLREGDRVIVNVEELQIDCHNQNETLLWTQGAVAFVAEKPGQTGIWIQFSPDAYKTRLIAPAWKRSLHRGSARTPARSAASLSGDVPGVQAASAGNYGDGRATMDTTSSRGQDSTHFDSSKRGRETDGLSSSNASESHDEAAPLNVKVNLDFDLTAERYPPERYFPSSRTDHFDHEQDENDEGTGPDRFVIHSDGSELERRSGYSPNSASLSKEFFYNDAAEDLLRREDEAQRMHSEDEEDGMSFSRNHRGGSSREVLDPPEGDRRSTRSTGTDHRNKHQEDDNQPEHMRAQFFVSYADIILNFKVLFGGDQAETSEGMDDEVEARLLERSSASEDEDEAGKHSYHGAGFHDHMAAFLGGGAIPMACSQRLSGSADGAVSMRRKLSMPGLEMGRQWQDVRKMSALRNQQTTGIRKPSLETMLGPDTAVTVDFQKALRFMRSMRQEGPLLDGPPSTTAKQKRMMQSTRMQQRNSGDGDAPVVGGTAKSLQTLFSKKYHEEGENPRDTASIHILEDEDVGEDDDERDLPRSGGAKGDALYRDSATEGRAIRHSMKSVDSSRSRSDDSLHFAPEMNTEDCDWFSPHQLREPYLMSCPEGCCPGKILHLRKRRTQTEMRMVDDVARNDFANLLTEVCGPPPDAAGEEEKKKRNFFMRLQSQILGQMDKKKDSEDKSMLGLDVTTESEGATEYLESVESRRIVRFARKQHFKKKIRDEEIDEDEAKANANLHEQFVMSDASSHARTNYRVRAARSSGRGSSRRGSYTKSPSVTSPNRRTNTNMRESQDPLWDESPRNKSRKGEGSTASPPNRRGASAASPNRRGPKRAASQTGKRSTPSLPWRASRSVSLQTGARRSYSGDKKFCIEDRISDNKLLYFYPDERASRTPLPGEGGWSGRRNSDGTRRITTDSPRRRSTARGNFSSDRSPLLGGRRSSRLPTTGGRRSMRLSGQARASAAGTEQPEGVAANVTNAVNVMADGTTQLATGMAKGANKVVGLVQKSFFESVRRLTGLTDRVLDELDPEGLALMSEPDPCILHSFDEDLRRCMLDHGETLSDIDGSDFEYSTDEEEEDDSEKVVDDADVDDFLAADAGGVGADAGAVGDDDLRLDEFGAYEREHNSQVDDPSSTAGKRTVRFSESPSSAKGGHRSPHKGLHVRTGRTLGLTQASEPHSRRGSAAMAERPPSFDGGDTWSSRGGSEGPTASQGGDSPRCGDQKGDKKGGMTNFGEHELLQGFIMKGRKVAVGKDEKRKKKHRRQREFNPYENKGQMRNLKHFDSGRHSSVSPSGRSKATTGTSSLSRQTTQSWGDSSMALRARRLRTRIFAEEGEAANPPDEDRRLARDTRKSQLLSVFSMFDFEKSHAPPPGFTETDHRVRKAFQTRVQRASMATGPELRGSKRPSSSYDITSRTGRSLPEPFLLPLAPRPRAEGEAAFDGQGLQSETRAVRKEKLANLFQQATQTKQGSGELNSGSDEFKKLNSSAGSLGRQGSASQSSSFSNDANYDLRDRSSSVSIAQPGSLEWDEGRKVSKAANGNGQGGDENASATSTDFDTDEENGAPTSSAPMRSSAVERGLAYEEKVAARLQDSEYHAVWVTEKEMDFIFMRPETIDDHLLISYDVCLRAILSDFFSDVVKLNAQRMEDYAAGQRTSRDASALLDGDEEQGRRSAMQRRASRTTEKKKTSASPLGRSVSSDTAEEMPAPKANKIVMNIKKKKVENQVVEQKPTSSSAPSSSPGTQQSGSPSSPSTSVSDGGIFPEGVGKGTVDVEVVDATDNARAASRIIGVGPGAGVVSPLEGSRLVAAGAPASGAQPSAAALMREAPTLDSAQDESSVEQQLGLQVGMDKGPGLVVPPPFRMSKAAGSPPPLKTVTEKKETEPIQSSSPTNEDWEGSVPRAAGFAAFGVHLGSHTTTTAASAKSAARARSDALLDRTAATEQYGSTAVPVSRETEKTVAPAQPPVSTVSPAVVAEQQEVPVRSTSPGQQTSGRSTRDASSRASRPGSAAAPSRSVKSFGSSAEQTKEETASTLQEPATFSQVDDEEAPVNMSAGRGSEVQPEKLRLDIEGSRAASTSSRKQFSAVSMTSSGKDGTKKSTKRSAPGGLPSVVEDSPVLELPHEQMEDQGNARGADLEVVVASEKPSKMKNEKKSAKHRHHRTSDEWSGIPSHEHHHSHSATRKTEETSATEEKPSKREDPKELQAIAGKHHHHHHHSRTDDPPASSKADEHHDHKHHRSLDVDKAKASTTQEAQDIVVDVEAELASRPSAAARKDVEGQEHVVEEVRSSPSVKKSEGDKKKKKTSKKKSSADPDVIEDEGGKKASSSAPGADAQEPAMKTSSRHDVQVHLHHVHEHKAPSKRHLQKELEELVDAERETTMPAAMPTDDHMDKNATRKVSTEPMRQLPSPQTIASPVTTTTRDQVSSPTATAEEVAIENKPTSSLMDRIHALEAHGFKPEHVVTPGHLGTLVPPKKDDAPPPPSQAFTSRLGEIEKQSVDHDPETSSPPSPMVVASPKRPNVLPRRRGAEEPAPRPESPRPQICPPAAGPSDEAAMGDASLQDDDAEAPSRLPSAHTHVPTGGRKLVGLGKPRKLRHHHHNEGEAAELSQISEEGEDFEEGEDSVEQPPSSKPSKDAPLSTSIKEVGKTAKAGAKPGKQDLFTSSSSDSDSSKDSSSSSSSRGGESRGEDGTTKQSSSEAAIAVRYQGRKIAGLSKQRSFTLVRKW
ncbi:unnamed protein product [Amoebophrya sp. A25]|nr:unnamed protein product [Amoebophrya sp. A25]|eukprot:GSA25T00020112001.1